MIIDLVHIHPSLSIHFRLRCSPWCNKSWHGHWSLGLFGPDVSLPWSIVEQTQASSARQWRFEIGYFLFLDGLPFQDDEPHLPTMWKSTIWRDSSQGLGFYTKASPHISGPNIPLGFEGFKISKHVTPLLSQLLAAEGLCSPGGQPRTVVTHLWWQHYVNAYPTECMSRALQSWKWELLNYQQGPQCWDWNIISGPTS